MSDESRIYEMIDENGNRQIVGCTSKQRKDYWEKKRGWKLKPEVKDAETSGTVEASE